MSLQPDTRLGTFEIAGLLGVGDMGEVYRATDAKLGREIVVNSGPAAFSQDSKRVALSGCPPWCNPPRLIGDLITPADNNSEDLSPHTGSPPMAVSVGFVRNGLPLGIQFLADAWPERILIELAYSYEQSTRHRVSPDTTPELL